MTSDILSSLAAALVSGEPEAVLDLARKALDAGTEPLAVVNDALVPGMREVGDKYSSGEYFLPNLIVSAACMKQAMAVLEPELKRRQQRVESAGRVIIGTVRGDIHEIGKSLVATMLAANGFEVQDLGVDVAPDRFVEAVRQTGPALVGLSALLTTTMGGQKAVIGALGDAGLRGRVRVMVGGAPINQKWADEIGADGYAQDAVSAVELARRLAGGMATAER